MNQIKSFGEYLRQFALSIDFINRNNFADIKSKIIEYLRKHLGAHQIAFCIPAEVDDSDGFNTVWSFPKDNKSQKLKDSHGNYKRQLTLAMGEWRNLWVISGTDDHLSNENRGIDFWGNTQDANLPPFYYSKSVKRSKTAIMLVTKNAQNKPNGILIIELERKVMISSALREELLFVAEAVGLLHASYTSFEQQNEATYKALRYLRSIMDNVHLKIENEPRPALFLAYSERAPQDSLEIIQKVLDQYKDHVKKTDWKALHTPGEISQQIVDQIVNAKYGICYFSETVSSSRGKKKLKYEDNPNVLFEAGMLNISTDSEKGIGTGWIPIREKDSPGIPFDIISQRRIIVPRDSSGNIDKKEFEKMLTLQLDKLITH